MLPKIITNPKTILFIIIILGFSLRCYSINAPLLEGAIGRQIQTATTTKNLTEDKFNIFAMHTNRMHLYDHEKYPRPFYSMLEFPLYNCIAGFIYKTFGSSLDVCGRLVSILCFIAGLIFFYKLVALYFGKEVAAVSTLIYSLFPVTIIFTRSFQPDSMSICCLIGCLYFFSLWIINDKGINLFLSAVLAGIACMVKQPNACIIIPLAYLSLNKFRRNFSYYPRLIIVCMVTLLPMAIWTYYASSFHSIYPHSDWNKDIILLRFAELLSFAWYKRMFEVQIPSYTPFWFTLFLIGLFIKVESKRHLFFHLWLGSVVVLFLGMPSKAGHDYYQLYPAPLAALFCGRTLIEFYNSTLYKRFYFDSFLPKLILVVVMVITTFCYAKGGFTTPHSVRSVVEAAHIINSVSAADDLIVTGYDSESLLYYSQRKGFVFLCGDEDIKKLWKIWGRGSAESPSLINLLKIWRKMGAKFFCQTSRTISLFYQKKDFYRYLSDNFPLVAHEEGEYIIFDLRRSAVEERS